VIHEMSGNFELTSSCDFDRLRNMFGPLEQEIIVTSPRTWRDRLFSRPWRPWHNVRAYRMTGIANEVGTDADDPALWCPGIKITGAVLKYTVRE